MDNTCFGYTVKYKGTQPIEMCIPLHCNKCENCRFYKPLHVLQHDLAVAEQRNKKLISGRLKTKYSLEVNGNKEGYFDSIHLIDQYLFDKFADENPRPSIKKIYDQNTIKIKKEEVC